MLTSKRNTAILCLIFLFAFSAVWAGNNNSKKGKGHSTTDSTSQESTTDSAVQTHNASIVVTPRYKGSGWFQIIDWVVFGEI
ncbi:MAG: hypothetical protein O7E52_21725, partial [Candidatus Poribacteria bacterium]|nr:hypothetical protein [Candidatus Poribacteria bacterium]